MPLLSTLLATLLAPALLLCRFTVRDIAYADLQDAVFTVSLAGPGAEKHVNRARELAGALLLDSNVEFGAAGGRTPEQLSLILRRADGESLTLPIHGADIDASLRDALQSVVDSELRARLLDELPRLFGVVLLFEGSRPESNQRAQEEVQGAFAQLESIWERMPKDVGSPPKLIRVADPKAERILCFALDVDLDAAQPRVATVFGRARRIGPVLSGDEINGDTLFGILRNAGADCECGLDRSWMQGPRLPVRWGEETRQQVADQLGFDPDSPMTRAEMRGILARGPNGARAGALPESPSIESLIAGYSEIPVEASEQQPNGASPRGAVADAHYSAAATIDGGPIETPGSESDMDWTWALYALGVVLLLSSLGTVYVMRRPS